MFPKPSISVPAVIAMTAGCALILHFVNGQANPKDPISSLVGQEFTLKLAGPGISTEDVKVLERSPTLPRHYVVGECVAGVERRDEAVNVHYACKDNVRLYNSAGIYLGRASIDTDVPTGSNRFHIYSDAQGNVVFEGKDAVPSAFKKEES